MGKKTMGKNIVQKIFESHLLTGKMSAGEEIGLRIDQTLTQDATGTMAYLQFEAMGIPRVRTKVSVSYVDHNTLQTGFENPDDHRYLQSVAAKYGIYFSRPGNGICHQVHLERFGVPGQTLLGSDSHTPTCGGIGMIAIGAGGLDVAIAMGGGPFYVKMPAIVKINLKGKLQPWVSAKDVILELLRRLTVKGGVNKIFEYAGEGVKTLSVPQRATITNMGAELGLTTSLFPSDEVTKKFLVAQGRGKAWKSLLPDSDAKYDEEITLDLSEVVPLAACPDSPDAVKTIAELAGTKVDQVAIGSCTNSSFYDLAIAAKIFEGKTVSTNLSCGISPGSRQVYLMMIEKKLFKNFVEAGCRILESACGPCIGMGFAPNSKGVSLRTFNRNFKARSGTKDAQVFLVSPETAAASAIKGVITDPRKLGKQPKINIPDKFIIDDSMIIKPPAKGDKVEILRGPNIAPVPLGQAMPNTLAGEVLLKVVDNITTDHIMPAGAKILPLRSNIDKISNFVFEQVDPKFAERAKAKGGGFILGGENYGQGSSREHAALAPMYLGVKAVIVKSFARIHLANLVNFGILPLTLSNPADYDRIDQTDKLEIMDVAKNLPKTQALKVKNVTKGFEFEVKHPLSGLDVEVMLAGGRLNYTKAHSK